MRLSRLHHRGSPTDKRPDGEHETTDPAGFELCPAIVRRIERALYQVGDFGEVRLIVAKGELKFIEVVQSENLSELAK